LVKLTQYEKILVLVFVLTLVLVNPWVRGDGVGYYAYGRSLLIQHNLDFKPDWLMANTSFRMGRTDAEGRLLPDQFTLTGHVDNHFSIGPAILWSPFLVAAHLGVLSYNALGGHVPADGFSKPYIMAMSLATAIYGFASLWLSFKVSRKYFSERWAFLATLGIWFASSLPVYMYFNPSWSHALSAFTVALFVWYWDRTRKDRSLAEWGLMGVLGGLVMDMYYPNAILLLFPLVESLADYWTNLTLRNSEAFGRRLAANIFFAACAVAAFLPTLVTKKIIYGGYCNFGYGELWNFSSPAFLKVGFSSDHGLFTWTPITILAVIGLWLLRKRDSPLSLYSLVAFVTYFYLIGCYQDWDGLSSFGNRFFVSLTPLFVLGVTGFFDYVAHAWNGRRALLFVRGATAVLILWNLGLIFQWGTHLIPARGPISWRTAVYNQVAVVPFQVTGTMMRYVTGRKQLMNKIEEEDVNRLKSTPTDPSE
jgi:hypothetical protein